MFKKLKGKRICICTPDYVHIVKNGGIGTSFFHTARLLAKMSADVTVLFANLIENISRAEIERAKTDANSYGVSLEFLFERDDLKSVYASFVPNDIFTISSYLAYDWLKKRHFDIIIFPDWRGIGYYSTIAKKQGLHFGRTTLWVQAHSTMLWHALNNQEPHYSQSDLHAFYLERKTVELCDFLTSPTQYLLDWMRKHGFVFPAEYKVMPYLLDDDLFSAALTAPWPENTQRRADTTRLRELVFFGRLEKRKGLHIFLQSLKRLHAGRDWIDWDNIQITFLGKLAEINGTDSFSFICNSLKDIPIAYTINPCLSSEEAIAYLKGRNALAIIASVADNSPLTVLESVSIGLGFLASKTGGIPEIIDARDHERVLFELNPVALAKKLSDTLSLPEFPPVRPACDQVANKRLWEDRLAASVEAQQKRAITEVGSGPRVTVCITHYERPELLRKTLQGLDGQTYRNFEVVIVDDGSTSVQALKFLENVKRLFSGFSIELLQQTNQYVGAARNKALSVAKGDYVVFMDDDNYAHPLQLETYVKAILNSGYDALSCVAIAFEGSQDPAALESVLHLYLPLGGSKAVNLLGNAYGDANGIFRRSALDAIGGFTEDWGVSWEDYELFSRLDQEGFKVGVVPEPLMYLRSTIGSVSRRGSMIDNYYRALRPALEKLPWESYGDLILYALNGSLAANLNVNYGAEQKTRDKLRILRHGNSPLAVSRLMLRRIADENGLEAALRQIGSFVKSSKSLSGLGLDAAFLALAKGDASISIYDLVGSFESKEANRLIAATVRMIEGSDGLAAFHVLHEEDVRVGARTNAEVAYLAGLYSFSQGEEIKAFRAWASILVEEEQDYLTRNGDIQDGVRLKHIANGLAHYAEFGIEELRPFNYVKPAQMLFVDQDSELIRGFMGKLTTIANATRPDDFRSMCRDLLWSVILNGDIIASAALARVVLEQAERHYLIGNEDVAVDLKRGIYIQGLDHWLSWGRAELRELQLNNLISTEEINTHLSIYLLKYNKIKQIKSDMARVDAIPNRFFAAILES